MEQPLKLYNEWHQKMSNSDSDDVLQLPWYKTAESILPNLNHLKVLEVGCGRGVFCQYLKNQYPNADITGVDFSEKAIEIASLRNKQKNDINFRVENAESLTFENDSFDIVISCETLEHVSRPHLMVKELYRVLKYNGECILTTENYFNGMVIAWLKCWLLNKKFPGQVSNQMRTFLYPGKLKLYLSIKVSKYAKRIATIINGYYCRGLIRKNYEQTMLKVLS